MKSMEAIRESNEHKRYQIAYRIYRLMVSMEQRAYTFSEIGILLGVSRKTAGRMIHGLETMGVPLFEESPGRWRILK